ncbi:hypothetical protein [Bosea sp. BE168]|nr:hypothetical protein [Bosea sp. BE168]
MPPISGARGLLVVLEGPNEVGKTTLADALSSRLSERGSPSIVHRFPGRMPSTLGEHVYRLHHAPREFGIDAIAPAALQALHVAAHLDAIERLILPALEDGINVVLDRYWWSTIAYGTAGGVSRDLLSSLVAAERLAWQSVEPSLAVLLDRSSAESAAGDLDMRAELRREYAKLAHDARALHPVALVENSGTFERTLDTILSQLELAINGATRAPNPTGGHGDA